jgi:hypothetical protein
MIGIGDSTFASTLHHLGQQWDTPNLLLPTQSKGAKMWSYRPLPLRPKSLKRMELLLRSLMQLHSIALNYVQGITFTEFIKEIFCQSGNRWTLLSSVTLLHKVWLGGNNVLLNLLPRSSAYKREAESFAQNIHTYPLNYTESLPRDINLQPLYWNPTFRMAMSDLLWKEKINYF